MDAIEQRSAAWFATRCGKVTASRVADVVGKTKTGWGAGRANYAAQLVAERLTGSVEEGFSNAAMQWGVEQEANARDCYCFDRGVTVEEIAFIDHPTIAMTGASPDGMVGDDGMVEIKCPGTAKHIATLTGSDIDGRYIKQMQWQMACAGRQWCDFVSYDPRMPVEMQLFVRRVERDDGQIAELEREIAAFLAEIGGTVEQLTALYRREAA